MKIFFEEHMYQHSVVKPWLHDRYLTFFKNDMVHIPWVGYYFLQTEEGSDTIFILPKVFINIVGGVEKAFGEFEPEEIIDTNDENNPLLKSKYFCEVFNLSTWIYRAIARYKERNTPENITELVDVQNVQSVKGEKSETMIDIILRLIRFNNEHRNLFTYIARINSQGHHKINWQKTISHVTPTIQDDSPIYMKFLNKSKTMNFDEELLVLFYSVLDYLHEKYDFKIIRNVNYPTDPREVERLIQSGKGMRLLRTIRRKYFKDELVELWELLYVFFAKAENVASKRTHEEALMVRDFNIVFEDMIDNLISDNVPRNLKEQPDGKIVDHIYRYESLMLHDDIYYIGDSKYYKEGHDPKEYSIFKQFTYAKNVIQMNMDIFNPKINEIGRPNYYDSLTEGYNVTPNFFIRGVVNPNNINYSEDELNAECESDGTIKVERRRHHANRLFDRDTFFVQKYSINFLYVLAAYSTNSIDESFKKSIQGKFRNNLLTWLASNYRFFVITPKDNNLESTLNRHFRTLLGKVYAYNDSSVILAMQSTNMDRDDDVENDLYEVYTAIHKDFELYKYDIINGIIGEGYRGERIVSIHEDEDIVEYVKELMKSNQNYYNIKLWVDLNRLFGQKYWGMTERDWIDLIDRYRFESFHFEFSKKAADESGGLFPIFQSN